MAYPHKIIEQAKKLYIVDRKTIRDIAKDLGIKRHSTVHEWIKNYKWDELRNKINTKAEQKAETQLIEKLAKDKLQYREENLKIGDLAKSIGVTALNNLIKHVQENPNFILDPRFVSAYSRIVPAVNGTLSVQDNFLFNKNKIELEGQVKVDITELSKSLIQQAERPNE